MTKIVAKALVRNSEGLYLVLHRGNTHPRFPGHIDFPGGEVESKETPEVAVMREIQEETGLLVDPKKLKSYLLNNTGKRRICYLRQSSPNRTRK